MSRGNLFNQIPTDLSEEVFETLAQSSEVKIERIISNGQASPKSGWYDQEKDEWVIVLKDFIRKRICRRVRGRRLSEYTSTHETSSNKDKCKAGNNLVGSSLLKNSHDKAVNIVRFRSLGRRALRTLLRMASALLRKRRYALGAGCRQRHPAIRFAPGTMQHDR